MTDVNVIGMPSVDGNDLVYEVEVASERVIVGVALDGGARATDDAGMVQVAVNAVFDHAAKHPESVPDSHAKFRSLAAKRAG